MSPNPQSFTAFESTTQHNTKANLKPLCYGMLEQTGVISFLKVNPCYTVFPPYLNEFELPRSFKARVDLLVLLYWGLQNGRHIIHTHNVYSDWFGQFVTLTLSTPMQNRQIEALKKWSLAEYLRRLFSSELRPTYTAQEGMRYTQVMIVGSFGIYNTHVPTKNAKSLTNM